MIQKTIEFRSKRLSDYRDIIRKESEILIEKIIKANSPVQVGDKVTAMGYKYGGRLVKITKIDLLIQGRYEPGEELLTFAYWGVMLKKDGETVMKNRNPILIELFTKDSVFVYSTPQYSRLEIIPARMYAACELFGSYDLSWAE